MLHTYQHGLCNGRGKRTPLYLHIYSTRPPHAIYINKLLQPSPEIPNKQANTDNEQARHNLVLALAPAQAPNSRVGFPKWWPAQIPVLGLGPRAGGPLHPPHQGGVNSENGAETGGNIPERSRLLAGRSRQGGAPGLDDIPLGPLRFVANRRCTAPLRNPVEPHYGAPFIDRLAPFDQTGPTPLPQRLCRGKWPTLGPKMTTFHFPAQRWSKLFSPKSDAVGW